MSPPDPASPIVRPLGTGPNAPQYSLAVPLGEHAARTEADMVATRTATAFDPKKIEVVMRDGRLSWEKRQAVLKVIQAEPLLVTWKKRMLHVSREQAVELTHLATQVLVGLAQQHEWDVFELFEAMGTIDVLSPVSMHWLAFAPVILAQGSAEQMDRWGSKAMAHQILGCYLQTELGHGTNVQALETTATFDPDTDTFDVHSPTLTSTKWWAGGAGLTATHGLVQAQLYSQGQSYGPHLFFVPLRNVQTGHLFEGIHAGDIGPKVYGAFPGMDNGTWYSFPVFWFTCQNAES